MFDIAGWNIREAGADDAPALALVGSATILETYAGLLEIADMLDFCATQHSAQAYRRYIDGGAQAWLAEAQGTGVPLGYALLCPPELDDAREGDIELKRIYALTRMQGTGLGRALMDKALATCSGYDRLLLGVHSRNTRALAFYERQGFAQIGTRGFLVGKVEHHDFVLARPLKTSVQLDQA
ncbi:GNAT family N-acetyltransferase [Novosphingobium sp. JCM 18896]|uniref:GNAT family N-acetyltransferase n=1 Tax=Novosphingobium sp. JCM 18896 TaxID=2989731 RepID=UPI002221A736|nr:N-acetyltransferase [Novosphingobium sp. JCM 18896]MCW1429038.1 GNAT family N-acetyltransferase [Novosphingobium sp. JCM 18896]